MKDSFFGHDEFLIVLLPDAHDTQIYFKWSNVKNYNSSHHGKLRLFNKIVDSGPRSYDGDAFIWNLHSSIKQDIFNQNIYTNLQYFPNSYS